MKGFLKTGGLPGLLLFAAALFSCTDSSVPPDTFLTLADPVNNGNGRAFHAAVSLPGNGDVLLVGGQDASGAAIIDPNYAERFQNSGFNFIPETGLTSATGRVAPVAAVADPTFNSDVVVAGGQVTGVTAAAMPPAYLPLTLATGGGERYDPLTGTTGITLTNGANGAALVTGADGTLYLIGGRDDGNNLSNAILYFNGSAFVPTGDVLATAREGHTATLLASGDILIAGGWDAAVQTLDSAELYDPLAHTVTPAGVMLFRRANHTATPIDGGNKVLLFGGWSGGTTLHVPANTAEVYDVTGDSFMVVSSPVLPTPRVYHAAVLLDNGDVLITGGVTDAAGTVTAVAEVYDPTGDVFRVTAGGLAFPRFGHTATLLPDRTVLIAGGLSGPGIMVPQAERYLPLVR